MNAGIGYAFVSKGSTAPVLNSERGSESGITMSFGAHTMGLGERPYKAEFLSNYSLGSKYLWTRAKTTVPVGYSIVHPSRLGFEATFQGSNKNGSSHSFAVGPVFETKLSQHFGFTVSAGPKFNSAGGTSGYLAVSLGISP